MKTQACCLRGVLALGLVLACGGLGFGAEGDAALPTWTAPFSTEKAKAYQCVRARDAITIDGRLNEADWERAQRIEGLLVPPKVQWETFSLSKPQPANSRTVARLMWDDQCIYLAAELTDRDIYGFHEKEHDPPFGCDDLIELFLKPSAELPYYWEFHVTPTGATRDYFYARRGAGGGDRWTPYESGMKAAVRLLGTVNNWEDRDQRWTVEIAIPWSAFKRMGGRPKAGDYWAFLVSRYDYSVYLEAGLELSAAAPLPRASYHLYEHYPCLVFVK